jgi:hypothetical protein
VFHEEIIKEIQEADYQNETRKFYRLVYNTRMGFKPRIYICRKTDGELATNKTEILGRWKEYFQELLEGKEESIDIDMDGEELIEGNSVEDN